ncbi:hypothetical protein PCK1_001477 [Pneumocystis canis]|nr:hypothetical protein PCK1_001477 [Pneumocystis canis]
MRYLPEKNPLLGKPKKSTLLKQCKPYKIRFENNVYIDFVTLPVPIPSKDTPIFLVRMKHKQDYIKFPKLALFLSICISISPTSPNSLEERNVDNLYVSQEVLIIFSSLHIFFGIPFISSVVYERVSCLLESECIFKSSWSCKLNELKFTKISVSKTTFFRDYIRFLFKIINIINSFSSNKTYGINNKSYKHVLYHPNSSIVHKKYFFTNLFNLYL